MNVCENHDKCVVVYELPTRASVIFSAGGCPLCQIQGELEEAKKKIEELESEVSV